MRENVRTFQAQQHRVVLSTSGAVVAVNEPPTGCSICGGPVEVQKTSKRHGVTLEHGVFRAVETVYACASGCRNADGGYAIHRGQSLAVRIPHRHQVGYDVIVFVGLARYVHHRQREEIQTGLEKMHGICLSAGEISNLGREFLGYLERLHLARANLLKGALRADGGWPLHVDATCEKGRGTLLVAFTSWRRWVLGAWKIPTERSDAILPRLSTIVDLFGSPCAAMRDLGKAVTEALDALAEKHRLRIPILACHLHFLRDIGCDLLEGSHDTLRQLVRRYKIRSGLAALARDLGRRLGVDLGKARAGLMAWQVQLEKKTGLPDGSEGLACVRAMAQWVLDFAADGSDEGFPFNQPYLNFYERGKLVRRASDAFSVRPSESRPVNKALLRLARILDPLIHQKDFLSASRTLKMRVAFFEDLRMALRLTPKPNNRNTEAMDARPIQEAAAELQDIRKSVKKLEDSLRRTRPKRGPGQDRRKAIDIILRHLDHHGRNLWGHVIPLTTDEPIKERIVERTNNSQEGLFHSMKRGERRRSGRKTLAYDMEKMPATAALATNLLCPDYVRLLCGNLENLPAAFSELDREQQNCTRFEFDEEGENDMQVEETEIISASLPSVDRKIIRNPALTQKILFAARSRAPMTEVHMR